MVGAVDEGSNFPKLVVKTLSLPIKYGEFIVRFILLILRASVIALAIKAELKIPSK